MALLVQLLNFSFQRAKPFLQLALSFVTDHAVWIEVGVFDHDPTDDWYRQPVEEEPRELTFVDEDTFWSEF